MQSYEKITNDALNLIMQLVKEFKTVDENFDLNKMLIFLSVALEDGVEAQELSKNFNIPKTTMSQLILSMCPQGYRKGKDGKRVAGSGIMIQEPSPRDLRAKALYLTFDGKILVDRLTEIIVRSITKQSDNKTQ